MARLDPADLFRADRAVQSAGDTRSIQSELRMKGAFKGDPQLLGATHRLYHIRNEVVHGAGARRRGPRLALRTGRVPENHAEGIRRAEGGLPMAFSCYKTPCLPSTRARYREGLRLGDARRRMAAEMPGKIEKEIPSP